jgi:DNA-binding winged helix-turn-helix (wHTH) protein
MRFRFGDCELDTDTRELVSGGRVVHLSPKAFAFLELLLEERPKALSKDAIHESLWPGTFVSDGTLTSLLAEVRSAIGDSAREPRFIRTVHGFGYAFSGDAHERSGGAKASAAKYAYRLFWGTREIALKEGENVLGRDPDVAIFLDHKSVSRRHARLTVAGGETVLEDLESKNGTFVGGRRVEGSAPVADGDSIQLGSVPLTFRAFALSGSTETSDGT